MQINILDARNKLSRLVTAAASGDEIVIANRGRPVAKLVPVDADSSRHTGAQVAGWLSANPLPAHAVRQDRDLDRQIAEEREGRE